jgi:hypothetical protein
MARGRPDGGRVRRRAANPAPRLRGCYRGVRARASATTLAGAGGVKDEKFEGASGNAVLLSQRGQEGTNPDIRQRRVVLDLPYLGLGG